MPRRHSSRPDAARIHGFVRSLRDRADPSRSVPPAARTDPGSGGTSSPRVRRTTSWTVIRLPRRSPGHTARPGTSPANASTRGRRGGLRRPAGRRQGRQNGRTGRTRRTGRSIGMADRRWPGAPRVGPGWQGSANGWRAASVGRLGLSGNGLFGLARKSYRRRAGGRRAAALGRRPGPNPTAEVDETRARAAQDDRAGGGSCGAGAPQ